MGGFAVLLKSQRLVSPHNMFYDFFEGGCFATLSLNLSLEFEAGELFDFFCVKGGQQFEEFFTHHVAVAEIESFEG